eukprot:gb/GFBE01028903.1/.p1 GENE.gb/GFBE01028903.1/~~gb/GFBE01028903.1/.p1  ORF type:complete len:723 (+),score=168.55 gb/GFBE01028903.1/:1-2169(+)
MAPAPPVALRICQGQLCCLENSAALLRDIEELAGSRAKVEPTTCLSRCGQGPNVEVVSSAGTSRVVTGVKTFDKMKDLVQQSTDKPEIKGRPLQIARLKYEARRAATQEDRVAKLEEALKVLGSADNGAAARRFTSQLLVLRSVARLEKSAASALTDAESAVQLAPTFPQAHLSMADALAALNRFEESITSTKRALELVTSSIEKVDMQKKLRQVESQARRYAMQKKITHKDSTNPWAGFGNSGESSLPAKASETANPSIKPLLVRLGGDAKLKTLVYGVYDKMRADRELGPMFEKFARNPATFQRLKERTVDYLNGEWGGTPYEGPDLFTAHASLYIDKVMYDAMMRMWAAMLDQMKICEPERGEALQSLEDMRPPICDPDGSFQKELEMRLAEAQREREEKVRQWKLRKMQEKELKEKQANKKKVKVKWSGDEHPSLDVVAGRSAEVQEDPLPLKVTPVSLTSTSVPSSEASTAPTSLTSTDDPQLDKESTGEAFGEVVRDYMPEPGVAWRFGRPSYASVNKTYFQHRASEHPVGSLECTLSKIIKNWEVETHHIADIHKWKTVDAATFKTAVNGGCPHGAQLLKDLGHGAMLLGAGKDLSSSFPEGFAWECLEVFSGPPQISFKWRHFGKFTGSFTDRYGKRHEGTGQLVNIIGMCHAKLTMEHKIEVLDVYYNPAELLQQLQSGNRRGDDVCKVDMDWQESDCQDAPEAGCKVQCSMM